MPDKYKIVDCHNYLPSLKTRHPIKDRNYFLNQTKLYCQENFDRNNRNNTKYNLIDQLVPPTNLEIYLEYIENLKVIIVDRDPRDVFIECCEKNDHVLPKNIDKFCKVYKDSRLKKTLNQNIMYIYFEDLIYNYQRTKEKIENFIGLNKKNHQNEGKFFSIELSKKNTKLWKKTKKYDDEVKYIEKELYEYLYLTNEDSNE